MCKQRKVEAPRCSVYEERFLPCWNQADVDEKGQVSKIGQPRRHFEYEERLCRQAKTTYDSHVVEANGGAIHSNTKEGHEETHVEAGARQALEDWSRVGLKSTLALGDSVPARSKASTREQQKRKSRQLSSSSVVSMRHPILLVRRDSLLRSISISTE